jgi:hypothetical protein
MRARFDTPLQSGEFPYALPQLAITVTPKGHERHPQTHHITVQYVPVDRMFYTRRGFIHGDASPMR